MWEKIYFYKIPSSLSGGAASHAQLPTVLCFPNFVRIYFAVRDERQYSSIYFLDVTLKGKQVTILSDAPKSCLVPGEIGCFDEHGVFPSTVLSVNGQYYLYYIGWNKGVTSPLFYASIGLATSQDGEIFNRVSPAPIMSRSTHDPCLVTSPNVYIEDDVFRMTYVSGVKWTQTDIGLQSHYHIKHATSSDGYNWERKGRIAIDFAPGETNVARSAVVKNSEESYEMWFSYVNRDIGKYRIGYASSRDGWNWLRNDSVSGIDVGSECCSEMICYPCVFDYKGERYMLFNGDSFGRDGFGIAMLGKKL